MGYYTTTFDVNFVIPAEHLDTAYRAACALNADDSLKSGGSFGGTPTPKPADSTSLASSPDRWFAWVDWNFDETCTDLLQVVMMFGFKGSTVDPKTGDLIIDGFDQKTGGEYQLLRVLAPFAVDGSYIRFRGEEDALYGFRVADKKLIPEVAEIIWHPLHQ